MSSNGFSNKLPGNQLNLDFALRNKLEERAVSVMIRDAGTIHLLNVPANERYFNKNRTNILIKRSPFMLCLDEDLEYRGADTVLARAFAGSARHKGWRVLLLGQQTQDSVS